MRRFVAEAIDAARTEHAFKLLAYVIMPEHVHLVILPDQQSEIGRIVGQIKMESAKGILPELESQNTTLLEQLQVTRDKVTKRVVWLRRCFDHNCRDHDRIREKIDYCHWNPVNRGLALDPSLWRFSSFTWYEGERDVPLEIDEVTYSEGNPTLRVGHCFQQPTLRVGH
jgi:putative transposase